MTLPLTSREPMLHQVLPKNWSSIRVGLLRPSGNAVVGWSIVHRGFELCPAPLLFGGRHDREAPYGILHFTRSHRPTCHRRRSATFAALGIRRSGADWKLFLQQRANASDDAACD